MTMTLSAAPADVVPPRSWTIDDIPDLSGRLALVTGANSGLGYVTARELARRGARVVLACRDPGRGAAALDQMRRELPGARLDLRPLDLASLASIRAFAERWDEGPLDLLVNNAGIALVPRSRTEDGFESHFGVNHLGTFALTGLMLPHLLAARAPRVVTVSSEGQRWVQLDLANLDAARGYHSAFTYWRSKKANVYFAVHLQRRAAAAGVALRSMASVPGYAVSNVLTGGANAGRGRLWHSAMPLLNRFLAKPTIEGTWTALYAATMPDLPGGSYVAPSGPFEFRGPPVSRNAYCAAYDVHTARRLWELSERWTGVAYDL
ncbi:oxidoreductase [Reyranella sp.]|uniref:oxidoreductase n=1 Tax=Reyranella sp. TaxID=1929291 RepID=UPI003D1092E9